MAGRKEMAQLALEHLHYIRGAVERLSDDIHDVKLRLAHLETSVAQMQTPAPPAANPRLTNKRALKYRQGRTRK